MKPFNLTLALFIFLAISNSYAQKSSAIFRVNPVGEDTSFVKVKIGQLYKFQISHINTIKLSGYTTSKPFSFEQDAPAIFSNTTIPDVSSAAASTTADPEIQVVNAKLLMLLNSETFAALKSGKQSKSIEALKKQLAAQNVDIEALKKQLALRNRQLATEFETSYNSFVASYQKLQRYTTAEDTLYKMIPDIIIRDVAGLKANARNYMMNLYGVTDDSKIESGINQTLADFNGSFTALKGAYQALNGTPVSDTSDIAGAFKNTTGSVSINVTKAKITIKSDPKFLEEYNSAVKIFNSLNNADSQSKLFNKSFKGIVLYRTIQNESFIAYTNAEQLLDDEQQTTPILKNSKGVTVKEFNPVTVKAYGGLKVNFTTGYLLTFRGDDSYSYFTDITTGKIGGITKQKSNALTNSIGALAHVYPRTASGASVGLSGGFSLTNNGNIGFYLGGSGLFLEKNRLALTVGVSYIKTNVLNDGNLTVIEKDKKYSFNSAETTINYDSLYKPGLFVGITYNIFTAGTKKDSAK